MITDEQFEKYIDDAVDALPELYRSNIKNVAFLMADEPSLQQREELKLACNQTLFGLYEGVPLSRRGGQPTLLPDRITIFKIPLMYASQDEAQLKQNIRRTVWHEVAHYYGLDHDKIHAIERRIEAER
jgi:predicted Zn-dependent protease with MMP-like domain